MGEISIKMHLYAVSMQQNARRSLQGATGFALFMILFKGFCLPGMHPFGHPDSGAAYSASTLVMVGMGH